MQTATALFDLFDLFDQAGMEASKAAAGGARRSARHREEDREGGGGRRGDDDDGATGGASAAAATDIIKRGLHWRPDECTAGIVSKQPSSGLASGERCR
jgi:hypothetical protein